MKAGSTVLRPVATLWQYFKDSWQELSKITWPSRAQTIRLTVAVLVFSVLFAAVSGVFDVGLTAILERVVGAPAQPATPPAAPQAPPANNIPTLGF